MAMNGRVRFVEVKPEAVAQLLVGSEVRYLSLTEAGPDELRLSQDGVPNFNCAFVKQAIGKTIVQNSSQRGEKKYNFPYVGEVIEAVRKERDNLLVNQIRCRDGLIRERESGKLCDVAEFETHLKACNRVMEMLWLRGNGTRAS